MMVFESIAMSFVTMSIFIISAGLHSELTTQGQVTPVRIKRMKSNEQGVPYNRYQPLCRRSLFVVSWLHLRFRAGTRW
jgi:hypothetical protein